MLCCYQFILNQFYIFLVTFTNSSIDPRKESAFKTPSNHIIKRDPMILGLKQTKSEAAGSLNTLLKIFFQKTPFIAVSHEHRNNAVTHSLCTHTKHTSVFASEESVSDVALIRPPPTRVSRRMFPRVRLSEPKGITASQ